MATTEQRITLRGKIGESVPPGGSADDTLVTDLQIDAWVDGSASMNAAALEGWEFKLAHWAGLVNVSDGAASRAFSDLMEHAEIMIAFYSKKLMGTTRSRARVGKIVRS